MSDILQATSDNTGEHSTYGVRIMLDSVTKSYDKQGTAAVKTLSLEIPAGELVALVGPSGCGKTTTLKMINRLIEPTSGRILIGDDDVTNIDATQLRRRIGYVIQAGGLFPHMTVGANIALVPRMLGWDAKRVATRVDELLELVSLEPETYRDRYPKQLSGGQQQRVGVARALAADPPVLLMDEPFGAVDPITRQRLQDELLQIQEDVQKTIVFVTHDFDEAVKLGDRIAIFSEGAHLVQYDTPERILAAPANDFVEDFIGSGAGLKQLTLIRVQDVEVAKVVTGTQGEPAADVIERLNAAGESNAVIVDSRGRPMQWLSKRQLSRADKVSSYVDEDLPIVGTKASLHDALDTMLVANAGSALVVGQRGKFLGLMDVNAVTHMIGVSRSASSGAPDENAPIGTNSAVVAEESADSGAGTDRGGNTV